MEEELQKKSTETSFKENINILRDKNAYKVT